MQSEEVAQAEAELEDQQSLRSEYFAQQDQGAGQLTVIIVSPCPLIFFKDSSLKSVLSIG